MSMSNRPISNPDPNRWASARPSVQGPRPSTPPIGAQRVAPSGNQVAPEAVRGPAVRGVGQVQRGEQAARLERLSNTGEQVARLSSRIQALGGEEIRSNAGGFGSTLLKGLKAFGSFVAHSGVKLATTVLVKIPGHALGLAARGLAYGVTGVLAVGAMAIDVCTLGQLRRINTGFNVYDKLKSGLASFNETVADGLHSLTSRATNAIMLKTEQGLGLKESTQARFQAKDRTTTLDDVSTGVDVANTGRTIIETGRIWLDAAETLGQAAGPALAISKGFKAITDTVAAVQTSARLGRIEELEREHDAPPGPNRVDARSNERIEDALGVAKKNAHQSKWHRIGSAVLNGVVAVAATAALVVGGLAVMATPVGWALAGAGAAALIGLGCYQIYKRQSRVDNIESMHRASGQANTQIERLDAQIRGSQGQPERLADLNQQRQQWVEVRSTAESLLDRTSAVRATDNLLRGLEDPTTSIRSARIIERGLGYELPRDPRTNSPAPLNDTDRRQIYQRMEMFYA